jgi:hypothetical protein
MSRSRAAQRASRSGRIAAEKTMLARLDLELLVAASVQSAAAPSRVLKRPIRRFRTA